MQSGDDVVRILLVEDEKKLAQSLQHQLIQAGYKVENAFDGIEADNKIQSNEFELIIMDLNLPLKSGLEVLNDMRLNHSSIPVLILSARDTVNDKITGLQMGADDYLAKPFDSSELLARIEAILRRSGVSQTTVLKAGDLHMDVIKRTVRRGDKEILLSPKEFALLEFFLRNKNQILTRKRLAEQVWGYKFDTGTNIVDVYISYLRKAIDDGFSPKLIFTIHGEGFLLKD